jgi:phosphoglycerate dehydrogenase-like enzyme
MSGANSFKFVLLPPQSDTTRDWAKRLAEMVPEARVIVAEDADTAAREIVDAEAAFGWLGSDLLLKATRLRWLQAPQAAPPAGYYYPELIAHPVVVTNFREIFNDHIGAHILAFVLAFARGLHIFIPQQLRREWKKSPAESGNVVHLPEATALIVGVGGIGSEAARLLSAFGVTVLGLLRPGSVPTHEADGLLHQYWPRNDDQVGRLGHGAGGGRDRRCGAGCVRTGAAAA